MLFILLGRERHLLDQTNFLRSYKAHFELLHVYSSVFRQWLLSLLG